jgi:hypothetical protein
MVGGRSVKQQYPAWDQPGRVQAAVAAVYKELP